jgi:hypothetical protein
MNTTAGHWYDRDGNARHTVMGKNGKERKTTLRDARKDNLYPSVTTVMRVLAAPELDRWKQQQVLLASLTLPRHGGESDDDYCSRIMQDAFQQVDDAADLGTRIHAAFENCFQGLPYSPEMETYISPIKEWAEKHKVKFLKHELRLVNAELGYAGTTDALVEVDGTLHVLDLKSRKTKPDYDIKPWSKEPIQIAAYANIVNAPRGVNLYISTTEPGRIGEAFYDEETLAKEFDAFKHVVALWQHANNYKPQA